MLLTMKKIFTTLSIALLSAVTAFAAGPEIAFDEKSYDFGTIAEDGGGVTHEFKFTNTGDDDEITPLRHVCIA